jgi:hypothetical protein
MTTVYCGATGQPVAEFYSDIKITSESNLALSPAGTFLVYGPDSWGKSELFGVISPNATRSGVKLDGFSSARFTDVVPTAWLSVDLVPARYKIQFLDKFVDVWTCEYMGNNTVVRRRLDVTVTVTDLKTNSKIASHLFQGPEVEKCNPQETFGIQGGEYRTVDSLPDVNEFATWLKATMSAYGLN